MTARRADRARGEARGVARLRAARPRRASSPACAVGVGRRRRCSTPSTSTPPTSAWSAGASPSATAPARRRGPLDGQVPDRRRSERRRRRPPPRRELDLELPSWPTARRGGQPGARPRAHRRAGRRWPSCRPAATCVQLVDGRQAVAEVDDDEVSVLDGEHVAARFREVEVEIEAEEPPEAARGAVGSTPARRRRRSARPDAQAGAGPRPPRPAAARARCPSTCRRTDRRRARHGGHHRVGAPHRRPRPRSCASTPTSRACTRRGSAPVGCAPTCGPSRRCSTPSAVEPLRDELKWLAGSWARCATPTSCSNGCTHESGDLSRRSTATPPTACSSGWPPSAPRPGPRCIEALDSPRYAALLDELVAIARRGADGQGRRQARPTRSCPRSSPRRTASWPRRSASSASIPPTTELHAVRKRAKRARYAAEAAVPAVGGPARRLAKALRACRRCSATTRTRRWPRRGCARPPAKRRPSRRWPPGCSSPASGPWPTRRSTSGAARGMPHRPRRSPDGCRRSERRGRRGLAGFDGHVKAAGGLPWRVRDDHGVEVLLVHRPRYDDWTFPKGKLDPGESVEQAAHREVEEETGLRGVLGRELPPSEYVDGKGRAKVVRYWEMTITEGEFVPNDEVDEIRWLARRRRRSAAHLRARPRGARVLPSVRRGATDPMSGPSTYRRVPNDPADWFSADELDRARRYQRPLTRLRLLRGALSLTVALVFIFGQVGPRLIERVRRHELGGAARRHAAGARARRAASTTRSSTGGSTSSTTRSGASPPRPARASPPTRRRASSSVSSSTSSSWCRSTG